MIEPPPLALYVHFPWCVRKCPYCDFNSHSSTQPLDQSGYVDALIRDLDFEIGSISQSLPALQSVFMGGGTPSLFHPDAIGNLLDQAQQRLVFDDRIEITMEANPGATEHAAFADYRRAGVNRLSIGVQSFDDDKLRTLGRIHDGDNAKTAFSQARAGGFDNINIDLMYGLPDQSVHQACDDLATAIALDPEHISLYQLTIEPNTVFHRYPPVLPDTDRIIDQQDALQQLLAGAGYEQYEVSAYARPGKQCRHNRNYWEFGDYLGIGAGAHGKLSSYTEISRRSRKKHPATWQQAAGEESAIAEQRLIGPDEVSGEYLMNALRLRQGFKLGSASARTGLPEDYLLDMLTPAVDQGLIEMAGPIVRCSPKGYLFLDSVLADLI